MAAMERTHGGDESNARTRRAPAIDGLAQRGDGAHDGKAGDLFCRAHARDVAQPAIVRTRAAFTVAHRAIVSRRVCRIGRPAPRSR